MTKRIWIAVMCVCVGSFSLQAQTVTDSIKKPLFIIKEKPAVVQTDSLIHKDTISGFSQALDFVKITADSIIAAEDKNAIVPTINNEVFKPSPKKAVMYSALFPGLGQIYNRKYWKLPIIYGGFMGCAYAIMWNNQYYSTYQQGYFDIMDDDETTDSWTDVLSYWQKQNLDNVDMKWLQEVFKKRKDYYRYYRDLSIIVSIGLYALCMIDAYVDAQLYDFDMSYDLSMRVEPVVFRRNNFTPNALGVRCSLSF